MGLFDAFKKDEVTGTKVLVCAFGGAFDDLRKNDERIYKRFYPATTSLTAASAAELKQALAQNPDILHLLCAVDAQGSLAGAMTGAELLQSAVSSGVKLLWIASDNFADPYHAAFNSKGLKLNVVLTERRLGPNFNLFLDNLLTKLTAGETFSKAWNIASKPEGRSVQPDVPHTVTMIGRGNMVLRP